MSNYLKNSSSVFGGEVLRFEFRVHACWASILTLSYPGTRSLRSCFFLSCFCFLLSRVFLFCFLFVMSLSSHLILENLVDLLKKLPYDLWQGFLTLTLDISEQIISHVGKCHGPCDPRQPPVLCPVNSSSTSCMTTPNTYRLSPTVPCRHHYSQLNHWLLEYWNFNHPGHCIDLLVTDTLVEGRCKTLLVLQRSATWLNLTS